MALGHPDRRERYLASTHQLAHSFSHLQPQFPDKGLDDNIADFWEDEEEWEAYFGIDPDADLSPLDDEDDEDKLVNSARGRQKFSATLTYSRPSFRLGARVTNAGWPIKLSWMQQLSKRWVLGLQWGAEATDQLWRFVARYFHWKSLSATALSVAWGPEECMVDASFVKDMQSVPWLMMLPRYERFLVAATYNFSFHHRLFSRKDTSYTRGEIWEMSELWAGAVYTNYWSNYEMKAMVNDQIYFRTMMSANFEANIELSLYMIANPVTHDNGIGWTMTWYL